MCFVSRSVLCVASLWFSSVAFGGTFSLSYTGNFTNDNDLNPFNSFTLLDTSIVTMQSWGFAGGVNGAGTPIAPGGFATVLALFDSNGI